MMHNVINFFKKEKVMTISFVLAIVSAIFVHPDSNYLDYIDFRVLALLFGLMIVVRGFQKMGMFELLIQKVFGKPGGNLRSRVRLLVLLCFFISMVITNDVALITFVPFSILALRRMGKEKYLIVTVVLETLAANLGSMFTPIGNPQNLFLFSTANLSLFDFFSTMWLVTLAAFLFLMVAVWLLIPKDRVELELEQGKQKPTVNEGILYFLLFGVNLLVVFHVLPWYAALLITVAGILFFGQKQLFFQVDYALLLTFAGFYIFIGNLGRIPFIYQMIERMLEGREILVAVLFSQFMSNVPAAILLSGFTDNAKALLLGTNIGGMGTLIASMASLISYKLYAEEEDAEKGKYVKIFTIWNLAGIALLLPICFL